MKGTPLLSSVASLVLEISIAPSSFVGGDSALISLVVPASLSALHTKIRQAKRSGFCREVWKQKHDHLKKQKIGIGFLGDTRGRLLLRRYQQTIPKK